MYVCVLKGGEWRWDWLRVESWEGRQTRRGLLSQGGPRFYCLRTVLLTAKGEPGSTLTVQIKPAKAKGKRRNR